MDTSSLLYVAWNMQNIRQGTFADYDALTPDEPGRAGQFVKRILHIVHRVVTFQLPSKIPARIVKSS
jgi:hypothetical protein